jgi:hypothetical protein
LIGRAIKLVDCECVQRDNFLIIGSQGNNSTNDTSI